MKLFENRLYKGPYGLYYLVPGSLFHRVDEAGWKWVEKMEKHGRFLQGAAAVELALCLARQGEVHGFVKGHGICNG